MIPDPILTTVKEIYSDINDLEKFTKFCTSIMKGVKQIVKMIKIYLVLYYNKHFKRGSTCDIIDLVPSLLNTYNISN